MAVDAPVVYYRIVRANPPAEDDSRSHQARGRPLRHRTPQAVRLWSGVSRFETEAQAREMARRFPSLGRYLARLEIPAGAPLAIERTSDTPGHRTAWGGRQCSSELR